MRSSVSSAPHLVWEDLTLSSPVIASCIGFASLFGFVWMVLVRFFAHFMVWTTVISLSAGCGIGAYYMWQQQIAAHMFYAQQGAGAAAPEGDDSRKRKAPDDAASD